MVRHMKSTRSYSKRRTDAVMAFCAVAVLITIIWRADSPVAGAVIAWGFGTIAACLGIYQGVGHADLRALNKTGGDNAGSDSELGGK